jgi:hypothetical protein
MKMRNIHARLKKLEARIPPPPPTAEDKVFDLFRRLRILAVGYYLGNPQPNEALAAAYARALGLSSLETSFATITQQDALAFDQLLAKFGVSRRHDWDTLIDAFKRMAEGFSEPYKEHMRRYAHELGIEWPFA